MLIHTARRLTAHPRVVPLTALLLRARTVRPVSLFLARESLWGKQRGGDEWRAADVYRLRETGLRVAIRHGTGDVVTLGEVFHDRTYHPPPGEVEQALGRVEQIVDLGANVGLFGAFAASRWPAAEIVAYEPDPANAAVHAQVIACNGLDARWTLVRAAAGAHDGVVTLATGDIALSRLADGSDTADRLIKVAMQDVLPRLAHVDLLKMDIEGGEWSILADHRFREAPPRVLVMEYHPHLCQEVDPHRAATAALTAAGLRTRSIWSRTDGYGMLWAWQG
jgi:FkbM family methyltransferase